MNLNKSLSYILPLVYYTLEEELSLDSNYFGKEVLPYIKNSYITYDNKDCFALLLKFIVDCKKSIIFEEIIIDEEDILIVFNIPKDHVESYSLFVEGGYSLINEDDKRLILIFTNEYVKSSYEKVSMVLYKSDVLRKEIENDLCVKISKNSELLSKINIDGENYSTKETVN